MHLGSPGIDHHRLHDINNRRAFLPFVNCYLLITGLTLEFARESPFPTGCRKSGTRGTRPSEGCEFCTDKQCTLVHQESITTACMISTIVAPSDVVGSLTVTEAP
jgi:hypothetical protein